MKPSRKPNKRTINRIARATAGYLRDLVATFCRERGGTMIRPRGSSADFGTFGASWDIPTRFGLWVVHEPSDPSTGLVSINTRFEDPAYITAAINRGELGARFALDFNYHSGKWNHHAEVMATNDPETFAQSFILDLKHRSSFLFTTLTPPETEPSDSTSCDERVAPRLPTDSDRARPPRASGHEVRRQRRAGSARVAGDDQDGVLAQDGTEVGGEALGALAQVGATSIVLRAEDVDRDRGLALPQVDAGHGRDGVAVEVAARRGRDRRRGLLRVDDAPQGRRPKGLALAETNRDADRARRDRLAQPAPETTLDVSAAEAHALSVVHQRAAFKKWAAPNYVVIWFDGPGRLRLTVEHMDAVRGARLVAAGWREVASGQYRRTVKAHELAAQLALVGSAYAAEIV